MTGDGILIDAGYNIAGVEVRKGRIRDVLVSSSNDNARKATAMTFQFGTTGTVPSDGNIVIFMPFGYSMPAPKLLAFNGLARTGTPQLISENFILTIRLGGGRSSNTSNISSNKGTGTTALDPTRLQFPDSVFPQEYFSLAPSLGLRLEPASPIL